MNSELEYITNLIYRSLEKYQSEYFLKSIISSKNYIMSYLIKHIEFT